MKSWGDRVTTVQFVSSRQKTYEAEDRRGRHLTYHDAVVSTFTTVTHVSPVGNAKGQPHDEA